jgi:hypothetical protein
LVVPLGGEAPGFSGRALGELGAVALTGVGHLVASDLDASGVFVPAAVAGWGGYVGYRALTDPEFVQRTGLRRKGLGPAMRDAALIGVVSLSAMAGVGAARGTLQLDPDMAQLLVLYPVWGTVQQFLTQSLVAGNLRDGPGWARSAHVVVPVTAAAFGAVHLPNWRLTAGTTVLGLAYTPLYLRHGNVWPLGLWHGWLGVFYYFWVLDTNPWRYVSE